MKVNLSILWGDAPAKGKVEVSNGKLIDGIFSVGQGEFTNGVFVINRPGADGICKIHMVVDTDDLYCDSEPAKVSVTDTEHPFSFLLKDIIGDEPVLVHDSGIKVRGEEDMWSKTMREEADTQGSQGEATEHPKGLPLYKSFTEQQRKQFGPAGKHEVLTTERHVYLTPFMYDNVDVGDFFEIDPTKGIEFKADTGFLTIKEEKPIMGVTVVGSGCTGEGYNICEWWNEGESIDNMQNQLVKRQRIDNLRGTHPAIWWQIMMGTFPGFTFNDLTSGITGPIDCMKKMSDGYYKGLCLEFYENTAYFRIGPPYPNKVTIRCGCKVPEDVGGPYERYPGDYAIRLVETAVLK